MKAHAPNRDRGTFLALLQNDGFRISKKKRVPTSGSQLGTVLELYQEFLESGEIDTVPNLACVMPRESFVSGQEIAAENWLPSVEFSLSSYEHWKLLALRQLSLAVANYPEVIEELVEDYDQQLAETQPSGDRPTARTALRKWFKVETASSSGSSNYPGGSIPYVSSGDSYNSIVEFVSPPDDEIVDYPCISVTGFGQACIQPWRFAARGNGGSAVRILTPRFPMTNAELFWFVGQINSQRWRFHYGRMAIVSRLKELMVDSPPAWLPEMASLGRRLTSFKAGVDSLMSDPSTVALKPRGSADSDAIAEKFLALAAAWRAARGPSSMVSKMAQHPAYLQIIQLGKPVVPLLLMDLKQKPDHWFPALVAIEGVDPVPAKSRGKLAEMAKAWISYGQGKGYIA